MYSRNFVVRLEPVLDPPIARVVQVMALVMTRSRGAQPTPTTSSWTVCSGTPPQSWLVLDGCIRLRVRDLGREGGVAPRAVDHALPNGNCHGIAALNHRHVVVRVVPDGQQVHAVRTLEATGRHEARHRERGVDPTVDPQAHDLRRGQRSLDGVDHLNLAPWGEHPGAGRRGPGARVLAGRPGDPLPDAHHLAQHLLGKLHGQAHGRPLGLAEGNPGTEWSRRSTAPHPRPRTPRR